MSMASSTISGRDVDPEARVRRLIYLADPMCSWCWGFSPVIGALQRNFARVASIHLILGGLFPFNDRVLDEHTKEEIRTHWRHVQEASGQPFDYSFFNRETFVYDTAPSSRAVVAAGRLDSSQALSFLARVHRAFYAENRDITDDEVLADVAEEHGFARQDFLAEFSSEATLLATEDGFNTSRALGIHGFPTLLAQRGGQVAIVTRGYQPLAPLDAALAEWFAEVA